jgi:tetratricopeptide (TPR) repeat protein
MVMGAILGLKGRWHIKNHRWFPAYFTGKRAKRHLEKALDLNPALKDALSGIGIYDYFIAKLPGIVRVLAFYGQRGDPAGGLEAIRRAIREGSYTVTGTRIALALILIRNEKRPDLALETIDALLAEYPRGPFIRALRLMALYDLGDLEGLEAEAALQQDMLKRGVFPEDYAAQALFAGGAAAFKAGRRGVARRRYERAVAEGSPADPFHTWSRLHLGFLDDLAGEREKAVARYEAVSGVVNRWGSRRLARHYAGRPFTGTDGEMGMLLLERGGHFKE